MLLTIERWDFRKVKMEYPNLAKLDCNFEAEKMRSKLGKLRIFETITRCT